MGIHLFNTVTRTEEMPKVIELYDPDHITVESIMSIHVMIAGSAVIITILLDLFYYGCNHNRINKYRL